MSKVVLPLNTAHTIVTNNGGTKRSFIFNYDGILDLPSNLYIGNTSNAFNAIINAANITASDKTFTLPNVSGTFALTDLASLIAMMPSLTGNNGKVLGTDGSTLSWVTNGTVSLTTLNGISASTYQAQTFAVGTSGLAPAWVSQNSNTNTHTLNIPMASTASVTAGLLSHADYSNIPFKNQTNTFSAIQTFTNAPQITNPSTGTNDVATYGQVLAAKAGLAARFPVAAIDSVTTAATLPTANPVIDGYTIQLNDRVLGTALTGGNAGKIFKATGSLASVTWVLETDGQAGNGSPSDGDIIFVKSGSTYADQQWAYNGTAWILYNRASAYTFSTGLTLTGTTVTVDFAPSGTSSSTKAVRADDSRLSDARTPTAHQLDSATYHTISGKTAGQVLLATSATTFAFTTFSQDITVNGSGVVTIQKINNVALSELALQQYTCSMADNTASATVVPTIPTWAIATYRAIRIDYSITRGSGNYVVGSITLLHDGTTPRITVTEDDSIGTHGVTFATDINSGNLRLLFTTTSTGTAATMKCVTTAFPV